MGLTIAVAAGIETLAAEQPDFSGDLPESAVAGVAAVVAAIVASLAAALIDAVAGLAKAAAVLVAASASAAGSHYSDWTTK